MIMVDGVSKRERERGRATIRCKTSCGCNSFKFVFAAVVLFLLSARFASPLFSIPMLSATCHRKGAWLGEGPPREAGWKNVFVIISSM